MAILYKDNVPSITYIRGDYIYLSGTFCNMGKKCNISPNLSLVSLEVIICKESSLKLQMYNELKVNGALTKEKSKCHSRNTINCKKKIHSFKTLTRNQQEEEIERGYEKEREGSPVPIFPS